MVNGVKVEFVDRPIAEKRICFQQVLLGGKLGVFILWLFVERCCAPLEWRHASLLVPWQPRHRLEDEGGEGGGGGHLGIECAVPAPRRKITFDPGQQVAQNKGKLFFSIVKVAKELKGKY